MFKKYRFFCVLSWLKIGEFFYFCGTPFAKSFYPFQIRVVRGFSIVSVPLFSSKSAAHG
jgi:hypothetical protein